MGLANFVGLIKLGKQRSYKHLIIKYIAILTYQFAHHVKVAIESKNGDKS
jgi:hypothetical protein